MRTWSPEVTGEEAAIFRIIPGLPQAHTQNTPIHADYGIIPPYPYECKGLRALHQKFLVNFAAGLLHPFAAGRARGSPFRADCYSYMPDIEENCADK